MGGTPGPLKRGRHDCPRAHRDGPTGVARRQQRMRVLLHAAGSEGRPGHRVIVTYAEHRPSARSTHAAAFFAIAPHAFVPRGSTNATCSVVAASMSASSPRAPHILHPGCAVRAAAWRAASLSNL